MRTLEQQLKEREDQMVKERAETQVCLLLLFLLSSLSKK